MSLETVTVTWDEQDVGADALGGYVSFQLTADLQDQGDGIDVRRNPAKTFFFAGPSGSSDPLAANDSAGITPAGTAYIITVAIQGQPVVTFTSAINFANGASQALAFLQANAAVPATQFSQYLPLPSGEPLAGYVPAVIADDSTATQWVPQTGGGGGGVSSVSVATANGFAGTVANPTTTPAITVKTTVTGLLKGNGTAVSAASAGTDYVAPTGSGAALTGITAAQVGAASTAALAAEVSRAEAAEALLAPLASPALTGTPTAPTPTNGDNTTKIATTAFVLANVGGGAVSSVFGRTGAVTATSGDYTVSEVTGAAPLASPALTGTPTAPTATALTDDTQVATTAYADAAVAVETSRAETAEALKLAKASNLSDLASAATARTNLGLGTAATHASTDFDAAGAAAAAQAAAEAASLPVTDDLSAIATANATAASVPMNSHKFTGLANGSASSDSAAFGQIPTALPPNGSASGDLSGSYPSPTVAKVNGAAVPLTKTILGSNGSGQFVDASAATLANNTSGNAATATNLAGGATLPDYLAPKAVTLSFVGSGTTLVDASLGNAFNLTLTASTTTLGNPSNPVDGEVIRFRITQGSGGSFTLAYGTAYDFGTAGAPTLSTSAAKVDILGFEYISSISKWCALGSGLGF